LIITAHYGRTHWGGAFIRRNRLQSIKSGALLPADDLRNLISAMIPGPEIGEPRPPLEAEVPKEETKPAATGLTPEEQMALFEKELKESDWGHQPC